MQIKGEVIRGDGYGRKISFPTVNIDRNEYLEKKSNLRYGIYGGFVTISTTRESYLSGIVVGPEDDTGLPKLEAHLIGYAGDLYGSMVTFHILEYIRPFEKYDSEEDLRTAIQNDIEIIKKMKLCLLE